MNGELFINVFHTPNGYMAQHVGDVTVIALFGTDTIPTAFTGQANGEKVLREVQRLNPAVGCVLSHGPMLNTTHITSTNQRRTA